MNVFFLWCSDAFSVTNLFFLNIFFFYQTAKSTVKLTPDAFTEASSYTGTTETEVRVRQFKEYLSGDLSTNPGLKVRKKDTRKVKGNWYM